MEFLKFMSPAVTYDSEKTVNLKEKLSWEQQRANTH